MLEVCCQIVRNVKKTASSCRELKQQTYFIAGVCHFIVKGRYRKKGVELNQMQKTVATSRDAVGNSIIETSLTVLKKSVKEVVKQRDCIRNVMTLGLSEG